MFARKDRGAAPIGAEVSASLREKGACKGAKVGIRPMAEGDLEEVMAIERASFPSPWTAGAFRGEMSPRGFAFVAEEGGRVKGYIVFRLIRGEVHVLNLAVAPDCRRKGVGKELLRFLVDFCTPKGAVVFWLEVREGNLPAVGLYRHMGFRVKGRRPRYYRDTGEDALIMELFMGGRLLRGPHGS